MTRHLSVDDRRSCRRATETEIWILPPSRTRSPAVRVSTTLHSAAAADADHDADADAADAAAAADDAADADAACFFDAFVSRRVVDVF